MSLIDQIPIARNMTISNGQTGHDGTAHSGATPVETSCLSEAATAAPTQTPAHSQPQAEVQLHGSTANAAPAVQNGGLVATNTATLAVLAPHQPQQNQQQPIQILTQPVQTQIRTVPVAPIAPIVAAHPTQQPLLPAGSAAAAITFSQPHPSYTPTLQFQFPTPLHVAHGHTSAVALLNANKTSQTPPLFRNRKLRSGKWTEEEEEYADLLIELFEKGHIEEKNGCTLRAFLSRKLHCAPMRISKKFAGKGIGKMVFLSKTNVAGYQGVSAAALAASTARLREAETKFYNAIFPDAPPGTIASQVNMPPNPQLVHPTPPIFHGLPPLVPSAQVPPTTINFLNPQTVATNHQKTGTYTVWPQHSTCTHTGTGAPPAGMMAPQSGSQAVVPTVGSYTAMQPATVPSGVQPILPAGPLGSQPAVQAPAAQSATAHQPVLAPAPLQPTPQPATTSQKAGPPSVLQSTFASSSSACVQPVVVSIAPSPGNQPLLPSPSQPTAVSQPIKDRTSQATSSSESATPATPQVELSQPVQTSAALDEQKIITQHTKQLHQTYLSVINRMKAEEDAQAGKDHGVTAADKLGPSAGSDVVQAPQCAPLVACPPQPPSTHVPASLAEPQPRSSPSNDIPDLLSGFDKVAGAAATRNHASSMLAQLGNQYSPPFTSRSFDDFHRFLGNLSPLASARPAPGRGMPLPSPATSETTQQPPSDTQAPTGSQAHVIPPTSAPAMNQKSATVLPAPLQGAVQSTATPSAFAAADAYNMCAQQSAFAASQHSAYTPQWRTTNGVSQNPVVVLRQPLLLSEYKQRQQQLGPVQQPTVSTQSTTAPTITAGQLGDHDQGSSNFVVSEPSNASDGGTDESEESPVGSTGGSGSESGGDNASNDSDGANSDSSTRKKMRISYNREATRGTTAEKYAQV